MVSVLPRQPLRHWIYTPTPEEQGRLRANPGLLRWVARRFVREIFAACGGGERGRGGAVTVVHWTSNGVEPWLHVHALVLDGVVVETNGARRFVRRSEDLSPELPMQVARGIRVALRRRLRLDDKREKAPRRPPSPSPERTRRSPRSSGVVAAQSDGVGVRATRVIAADDRMAVIRLARYLTRPWLEESAASTEAAKPGVAACIAAASPRAHSHPIAFHGVLARHAAERGDLVPGQVPLWPSMKRPVPKARRLADVDRERCSRCGGKLQVESAELAVHEPAAIAAQ